MFAIFIGIGESVKTEISFYEVCTAFKIISCVDMK